MQLVHVRGIDDALAIQVFQHGLLVGGQLLRAFNAMAGVVQADGIRSGLEPAAPGAHTELIQPGYADHWVLRGIHNGRLEVRSKIPGKGHVLHVGRKPVNLVAVTQHILDVCRRILPQPRSLPGVDLAKRLCKVSGRVHLGKPTVEAGHILVENALYIVHFIARDILPLDAVRAPAAGLEDVRYAAKHELLYLLRLFLVAHLGGSGLDDLLHGLRVNGCAENVVRQLVHLAWVFPLRAGEVAPVRNDDLRPFLAHG